MPYYIYIEGISANDNEGCFAAYWFRGEDLADAIHISLDEANSQLGLQSTKVQSALYVDDEEPPVGAVETDHPKLLALEELHTWPLADEDPDFEFPAGIVPSNADGPCRLEEIRECYFSEQSESMFSVTVVVDGRRLIESLTNIFDILPSKDGLEINIKEHWNDRNVTEIWIAGPEFTDGNILDFLLENDTNLICNGGVEVAIYSRKEKTTLRFTDHKIFRYYAEDIDFIGQFVKGVARLGYSEMKECRNILRRYHHYHYAPKGARTPAELKILLSSSHFKKVDERVEGSG